jgi:hypothetical protein
MFHEWRSGPLPEVGVPLCRQKKKVSKVRLERRRGMTDPTSHKNHDGILET